MEQSGALQKEFRHLINTSVSISITHLTPLEKGTAYPLQFSWASLVAQLVKEQYGRPGFDPCIGKIPWRREWLPTPVFLPGEFHGQRSLASYSPCSHEDSDTTE